MHCLVQTVHWILFKQSLFISVAYRGQIWPSRPPNSKQLWYAWTLGLLGSITVTKKEKRKKMAPLFTCMKWFRGKGEIICTGADSWSWEAESEVNVWVLDRQNKLFQPIFQFHLLCSSMSQLMTKLKWEFWVLFRDDSFSLALAVIKKSLSMSYGSKLPHHA